MKSANIAIIGLYPPPIGGVSVHVERLTRYLKDNDINFVLYDISKVKKEIDINYKYIKNMKLWLISYLFGCSEELIHLHERNWYMVAIICLIAKIHRSKVILTLHSFREEPSDFNFLKNLAFRYSIKRLHCLIPVGENEKNKLIKYGTDSKKIAVIPAYINPENEKEADWKIPDYIWKYMNGSDFCIIANASTLAFYNNQDLYGFDLCIDICYKLKIKYCDKKIKFIFCLPDIENYEYYKSLKDKIAELNIEEEFLIVNDKIPLYPILKKAQLFIRPTNTDSYGNSIAEALYYKVPAIASDVCKRPDKTILFKNRDIDDLYNKTVDVIENYKDYKDKLKNIIVEDNAERILRVYEEAVRQQSKL